METTMKDDTATNGGAAGTYLGDANPQRYFCAQRDVPPRVFASPLVGDRERLLINLTNKWLNGTVLHYYFFDQPTDGEDVMLTTGGREFRSWVGAEKQRDMVREGFETWRSIGIGLRFAEVAEREDAEIRIGFMPGDGAWSLVGRGVLGTGMNERTMNFGWDLTAERDTATHEIGHTIGFNHEHQNSNSGIEWDEEAVYQTLAGPPNNWPRERTFHNILRRMSGADIRGSVWDPDSIMHYPFPKGLIRRPQAYFVNGLTPKGGLSDLDKAWALKLYPQFTEATQELLPAQSVPVLAKPGDQVDFIVKPTETRYYEFRTFGTSDVVMALFQQERNEPRYRSADDDAGETRNASLRAKLVKGETYLLRLRVYYHERPAQTAIMMW